MNSYVVLCFGREINNKVPARLFGQKIQAGTNAEAILRYRQYLKSRTSEGYVEYGSSFEGIFPIGHMVFDDFEARLISMEVC